jgi:hypothetical protein
MSPQTIRTIPKPKLVPARRVDVEETTAVADTECLADVFLTVDEGNGDGPLDGSPTKNILPPIGKLRPVAFWN